MYTFNFPTNDITHKASREGFVTITNILLSDIAATNTNYYPRNQFYLVAVEMRDTNPDSSQQLVKDGRQVAKPCFSLFSMVTNIEYFQLFKNEFFEKILKFEKEYEVKTLTVTAEDAVVTNTFRAIFESTETLKLRHINQVIIKTARHTTINMTWHDIFDKYNDNRPTITHDRIDHILSLLEKTIRIQLLGDYIPTLHQISNTICADDGTLNGRYLVVLSTFRTNLHTAVLNIQQSSNKIAQSGIRFRTKSDYSRESSWMDDNYFAQPRLTQYGSRFRYGNSNEIEDHENIITVSVVVFNKSMSHVALTQEVKMPYRNKFYLPSGKQCKGESVSECVIRKVREEIDVTLTKFKLVNIEDNGTKLIHFNFVSIVDDFTPLKNERDNHSARAKWAEISPLLELEKFSFSQTCGSSKKLSKSGQKLVDSLRYCDMLPKVMQAWNTCNHKGRYDCDFENRISYKFDSVRLIILAKTEKGERYFLSEKTEPKLLPEIILSSSFKKISKSISDFLNTNLNMLKENQNMDETNSSTPKIFSDNRIIGVHNSGQPEFNGLRFDVVCNLATNKLPLIKSCVEPNNLTWTFIESSNEPVWTEDGTIGPTFLTDRVAHDAYWVSKGIFDEIK